MIHRSPRRNPVSHLALAGIVAIALLGQACVTGSASPYPDRVRMPPTDAGDYVLPTQRCGDFFLVESFVNGTGPYLLLLDSGAGRTVLDPSVLAAAGAENSLDSLRIGAFHAFDLGAAPLEMEDLGYALRAPVLGILGHPVFAGGTITYDYPRGEIRLARDGLRADQPGVVPARESSRPWIRGEVDGRAFWILLDTGSGGGLTLVDLDSWPLAAEPVVTGTSMRVDGIHSRTSARLTEIATVGPVVLRDPIVTNSVSVNLFGQDYLRHFEVTFDARNDRVLFRRGEGLLEAPLETPAFRGTGHTIRPLKDAQVVLGVLPGSPAEDAGMAVGDTILAVDGTPVERLGCREPRAEGVPDPSGVRLHLRRAGQELEITIPFTVLVN